MAPAEEEARLLDHNWLGTEHLMLGLIREVDGVGAMVLSELGADQSWVRLRVTRQLREGWREPRS